MSLIPTRAFNFVAALFCMSAMVFGSSIAAQAGNISTGGVTSQPAGHHDYCNRGGRHCGGHRDAGPAQMNASKWATVKSVNAQVNRAIKPMSDMQSRGVAEYWSNGGRTGDCEDYALKKRSILLSKGFKPSQLPLVKTRLRNGEAHIVLVVRTTEGDYVLDNLRNDVPLYKRTGYRFLKMQSASNSSQWVSIRG